jgi:hypothetical protein
MPPSMSSLKELPRVSALQVARDGPLGKLAVPRLRVGDAYLNHR